MKSTCYVKNLLLGLGVGVCDAMYFNLLWSIASQFQAPSNRVLVRWLVFENASYL